MNCYVRTVAAACAICSSKAASYPYYTSFSGKINDAEWAIAGRQQARRKAFYMSPKYYFSKYFYQSTGC